MRKWNKLTNAEKSCSRIKTSATTASCTKLKRSLTGVVLPTRCFAAMLFWSFSKCHVIKISKIFGDFVPRDPAFARVFSRRSAILKIVEGTRLTALGGLYDIFEAWLVSSPTSSLGPSPRRFSKWRVGSSPVDPPFWKSSKRSKYGGQLWMNFSFICIGRHHCKSRILERMENFRNDCCRSWTKKPFKNSYPRQLRIVNAVVCLSPAGQIDWPKSVFLQDKVTLFETMMTTMNEANRDKTKVPN